ncbi:cytokinesis protein 3 [Linnemannia schmuckeri]|uniref:Cytokinesis protein 3 n=1 Tax=Linnemannia schmuckeri TaxID=64567 RepID=A0A9P5RJD1_9FUNG|nr:cytokinesis protein 3 [Linnemannia schmuckeri]
MHCDIIKVHDNEGGWWKGSLLPDYIFGSFPSNFVEIISTGEDSQESPLSPTRPQRPHSRQSSVDSSKFTKRKPVNSTLSITTTAAAASSTTSLPYPDTRNASSVSLSIAASRKNPQAIIGNMNQFEEPVSSSPRSEPQQTQQQQQRVMNRRPSQSSQKSTQFRLGHIASQITGILSPISPTSTTATDEAQGHSLTPKQTSTLPGAFPTSARNSPTRDKSVHDATKRYSQPLLNPTSPTTLTASQIVGGRHLNNRSSMPNLTGDAAYVQQSSHDPHDSYSNSGPTRTDGANAPTPGKMYLQDANDGMRSSAPGAQSAYNLPRGNASGISLGGYGDDNALLRQEHYNAQDPRQCQSGMMPRSSAEYYNQQMYAAGHYNPSAGVPPVQQPTYGYNNNGATQCQQSLSYRHSIANFGSDQPQYNQEQHPLVLHSDLSLENLAKHNRSQSALDAPRYASQGSGHVRSRSQANLRPEGSAAFNPYDHQHQQQSSYNPLPVPPQAKSAPMNRLPLSSRVAGPSITIPQARGRPQSALASYGPMTASPTESSPPTSASSATYPYRLPSSPSTPGTTGTGTPTSAGTSMSGVSAGGSASGTREQRRKSETARITPSASMTASTFTARKFSIDARTGLAGSTTSASFLTPIAIPPELPNMSGGATQTNSGGDNNSAEDMSGKQEGFGTYTAKKPKSTLIRTFKQIINPRKVAEKDADKNKREHFAWIEMQKSLKRVPSPDIGKERPFFASSEDAMDDLQDQDPFEVLKRCHVMRDTLPAPGATTVNSLLDVGPAAFIQVDKVARNVNQRGPHMTPQLLSQKYLTRPYSKAPLSKLRVLFVWVSENIRLEGGPGRDVSGGRYKLGPGSEPMSTTQSTGNAAGESPSLRAGSNNGVGSPSSSAAAACMTGPEDYSRGLLQEDSPELAQEVLSSRTCKTGEGFANLFAEMALAAGIEDVGVVKGYIKGPMDVFSKEVPPANHAWNVVRINGTYRFIDCCLASPFHPAHYPNRPQFASSFYFLTSPMDLVLSHFPLFLTYQYITPSIPPQIFLRLPFVRPAFFDFGLSLPEFKRRTRLEVKDDESIEVVIRIDGGGVNPGSLGGAASANGGSHTAGGGQNEASAGTVSGLFGGECLGRGCGEGIELRAEVEAMTAEGRVIKKRALAQIMIWNPYQAQVAAITAQGQQQQQQVQGGSPSSTLSVRGGGGSAAVAAMAMGQHYPPHHRQFLPHHCTGIRIAKIKAVLPSETVVGAGGIRKGVIHIYAGRKVENAPADATPYSLALTLPVRHTGTMPKTPFSFVLPHFSPYEFYVKSPQSEMLYYPHTYKFCVLSLAAQGQASAVSANAVAIAENDAAMAMAVISATSSSNMGNGTGTSSSGSTSTSPRHVKAKNNNGTTGSAGSASMAPMYRPQSNAQQSLRSVFNPPAPAGGLTGSTTSPSVSSKSSSPSMHPSATTASMGALRLTGGNHHPFLQQHQMSSSMSMASTSAMSVSGASSSSSTAGGVAIPRPERLVLRTQTNRIYKLVYDPIRQCHEAQVEVKERGIWECVRMDDGGKSRVGREGAGGVVIATWRCV